MSQGNIEFISVSYDINISNIKEIKKEVTDVNEKFNNTQQELDKVNKLLEFDSDNSDLIKQKQILLKNEIESTQKAIEDLEKKQNDLNESSKNLDNDEFRKLQRDIIGAQQKLSSLKDEKASISVLGKTFDSVKGKISSITSVAGAFAGKVSGACAKASAASKKLKKGLKKGFNPVVKISGLSTLGDQAKGQFEDIKKSMTEAFAPDLMKATQYITDAGPGIQAAVAGIFAGNEDSAATLSDTVTKTMNSVVSILEENLPSFLEGFNTVIISLLTGIGEALPTLMTTLLPVIMQGFTDLINAIIPIIPELLPAIIDAGLKLFSGLLQSLNQIMPTLLEKLPEIISKICIVLVENIPVIIQGGIQLFMGLLQGLGEIIPLLLAMLPTLVSSICASLIANLPLIITGGVQLLTGLITGISESIPMLIDAVIALIPVITTTLIENLPALIDAGIQLIVALATGLPKAIPSLIKEIPKIIKAIIDEFAKQDWLKIGSDILMGIGKGLLEGVRAIGGIIKKAAGGVVNKFKNFFGIHSPSKLFKNEVGKFLALGLGEGFAEEMMKVSDDMLNAVPTNFDVSQSLSYSNSTPTVEQPVVIQVISELDGKQVGYGVAQYVSSQQGFRSRRVFV